MPAKPPKALTALVVAARKGGAGKTTLSAHVAAEAAAAGMTVVAIDLDPQASLTDWHEAGSRQDFTLLPLKDARQLPAALAALQQRGVDLAVVDTPPAQSPVTQNAIAAADLVLIPCRPSGIDLRAVGSTLDMAEDAGRPVVFVVNSARARSRLTSEIAVALSQHGTVAPVQIVTRDAYPAAMGHGRTAGELNPNSPAAQEIAELWRYLSNRLKRPQRNAA